MKRPGTALAAVLTLGVGLGAAVGILGVTYGMFRPLPVPDGERIVRVELRDARGRPVAPPAALLEGPDPGGGALARLAAYRIREVVLRGADGSGFRRSAAALQPEVFELLGVEPALGRVIAPGEEGGVVLGHELRRRMFGDADDILGASLRVDGRPHTVVGVMPEDFGFPLNQALWLPLHEQNDGPMAGVELVGRLAPDAKTADAENRLETRLAGLPDHGTPGAPSRALVRPFVGGPGESGEAVALVGLGVLVAILLAIAAANVSTLLLVRAVDRADGLAVHAALGASRFQVGLQLFAEALLIAAAGGALGLALGHGLLTWIEANLSAHWGYYWMRMEVRGVVVAWTVALVTAAAVMAGTAPALRAARTDLQRALKSQSSGADGARRLGRWFLGAQVALSTAGLVAAVFLGTSLVRSGATLEGLPLDDVTLARLTLDSTVVEDPEGRHELAEALGEALSIGQPSGAVSVSTGIPVLGGGSARLQVRGSGSPGGVRVTWTGVDPSYFDVYGLALLRGRLFGPSDGAGASAVAVVNESFVRRHLGGSGGASKPGALGTFLQLEGVGAGQRSLTIVGVVEDALPDRPGTSSDRVYLPLSQIDPAELFLSVRGVGSATATPLLRKAVATVSPDLLVEEVSSLRDFAAFLSRIPRTLSALGALGGLAGVLVASIGLYGLMAFQVRTRFPELGIRMALGAPSRRILLEVLGEGVRRLLPGLVVGMVLGSLLSPLFVAFLFGLGPSLVAVYAGVAGAMLTVGLLASLIPALRAATLSPLSVLRSE